jgi:predicted SprT family Zn-dependent metalloprotease
VEDTARLQAKVKKWARLWRVPSLTSVEITTNSRLRTCLGRCFPKLNRIELNTALLYRTDSRLNEVLCHEAAHIADYLISPHQSRAHSPQWARLMTTAGFKPQKTISGRRCIPDSRRDKVRNQAFEHYCPVCRFTRIARKPVPRWKCRTCVSAGLGGDLKIRPRRVQGKDQDERQ